MKTYFAYFLTLVLTISTAGIARATSLGFDLGGTNVQLLAGSTFTLNQDTTGIPTGNGPSLLAYNYQVGQSLVGKAPERQDIADAPGGVIGRELFKGSSNLVFAEDEANSGDGYIQLDSNGGGRLAFIDGNPIGPGRDRPALDKYFVQAAVRPGSDQVAIGMMNDSNYFLAEDNQGGTFTVDTLQFTSLRDDQQDPLSNWFGQLWMSLDGTGEWAVYREGTVLKQGFISDAGAVIGTEDSNFDASTWRLMRIDWDTVQNRVTATIDGVTVLASTDQESPLAGFVPSIRGFGFQLGEGASLDNFAATPEPSSMLMMCFGMLFFGMQNRRQRRRAQKLGLTSSIAG